MLLQVLADNIQHKDRLLTNHCVTRVETTKGGVEVYTKDNSKFTGDIVVGADGIHSVVRTEMWRNAKEQSPGYFPEDEDSRTCLSSLSSVVCRLPSFKNLQPTGFSADELS